MKHFYTNTGICHFIFRSQNKHFVTSIKKSFEAVHNFMDLVLSFNKSLFDEMEWFRVCNEIYLYIFWIYIFWKALFV